MNYCFRNCRKIVFILSSFFFFSTGCSKKEDPGPAPPAPGFTANANPTWKLDAKCFTEGATGSFDDLSVKDPSIVYFGGKYHLFYTVRSKTVSGWQMGYASASQIADLNTAPRTYMSALNGGSYFCAPQVFWFSSKNKWYLIYQSGLGATFSTNTDINNPSGWSAGASMGFGDGIDFWCISDGSYVYCFYSAQDGSKTIKKRRTKVENFPYGWEAATVAATNTFEAPHVYKNKADGKYYMIVEDIARHQELWAATNLGGTWTQLAEKWASIDKVTFGADHWTDQVSHIEALRSGTDEKLEIENINHCDLLIQGVTKEGYSGDYADIAYDLGLIHNY
ncbi:MAG TPA: non-reducing end alpha-L-arabinofuranosidase family hydrolase [Flavisolibacter sp.]|nr:non-reducing end alpha-L-arabinofuranosidase family hydrolase [Flavisolibacter sp.]